VVATDRGAVRGVPAGNAVAFRGIPYVAPPVGSLRFRAPEIYPCWSGIREATAFGPACPQLNDRSEATGDEDCLALNVWTPTLAPAAPLPVLFFLHGGGNNQGSSAVGVGPVALYDGRRLAEAGNVVVTLNYRLGALGFLVHERLDVERPVGTSGNWGLLDQIAALSWVQRNIRAFGGDPSRVLLFGESAGGLDTCALLASPLSTGLFSRALLQSGGCAAAPRAAALNAASRLVAGAGCAAEADPIACLRARTPAEILRALPANVTGLSGSDFGLSEDGFALPKTPLEAIRAGEHLRVPVVLGTNRDETSRMLPPPTQIATAAQYEAAARAFLSQFSLPRATEDAVLAIYPLSDYPSPHAALVALTTDIRWSCPSRVILRALVAAGSAAWRYYFTQALDPARAPALSAAGAYHGIELPYLFGTLEIAGYRPTDADWEVSRALQGYWSRFAATGDPNGAGAVAWPAYEAAADPYLGLAAPPAAGAGVRSAQCNALEALLPR
jgi:para-nitrobenzyl esterase